MQVGRLSVLRVTVCSYFLLVGLGATLLPNSEVGALKEIAATLGKTNWNFSVDPCSGESGWVTSGTTKEFENAVKCECTYDSSSVCHVVSIVLKSQSLPGILPPELVKLPYLQQIDLSRNYLNGSIPREWGSMKLVNISLGGNRISGSLPIELANITTLKSFVLEFNFVSGVLPHEFGNLPNIQRMIISSNKFSGPLPETLAKLTTLKDFRINDNHFTGKIPDFIQSWTNIERLAMVGSGLEGPIPSGISFLTKLSDMRICDINSTEAGFPPLTNLKNMTVLVLRSCNITGEIPSYVGDMTNLQTLDLSFNKLTGQIPSNINSLKNSKHIILAGNALTGPVPAMPKHTNNIDLSYNNLTLGSSRSCQEKNINLFKSSSDGNNLTGVVSCLRSFKCPSNLYHSFHINCGGREVIANGSTTYREDTDLSGASTFFSSGYNWGYSSTGTYTETSGIDNYTATNVYGLSMKDNELYTTARLSPLSLTYYGFCLHNGNYTVNLHFAEIMFTNDNTYRSLGRRLFDVYIQGKLVLKDFNIEDEAGGVGIATIKTFTAVVVSASLEIRFYWAGKGTTGIPSKGTYGPLISAISVDADFQPPSEEGKTVSPGTVVGILLSVVCTILIVLGALWWKGWFQKNEMDEDMRGLDLQTGGFTLKQIKAATNNFDPENKIGEGGFGPVYKGILADGSTIAVKQLSSKSKQGSREFLNEIGMISALQHPNLVKLYGCCTEGNQLLLVYEYMENNSLAHSLFEREESQLKLDWPTRHNICVGLARALTYLHEESRLKIVHRDIKATNVLLDKDLNAKVSDFGLAKLDEENRTHISTRIAGTYGYMAPEYAMRGHLTDKADVYSFGVVVLEMVSGRTNTEYIAKEDCVYLLDWVLRLQERGELLKLVDARLESNYVEEEVLEMIEVALQCINTLPALRPTMSTVVSILEGRSGMEKLVSGMSIPSYDKKSETTNKYLLNGDQNTSEYQTQSMSIDVPWTDSSNYEGLYHANPNTEYWNIRE